KPSWSRHTRSRLLSPPSALAAGTRHRRSRQIGTSAPSLLLASGRRTHNGDLAIPIAHMPHYSRRHLCLALFGAALPWRARAGFNFWNSEYTATRSELQAMISTRFPLSQRYAQIISVELSDPQLGLNPSANRAAIAARVSITSPLL